MLGKTTYLCNFVRLKGKSIFPLRGTQTNNRNSVARVRDWQRYRVPQKARRLAATPK